MEILVSVFSDDFGVGIAACFFAGVVYKLLGCLVVGLFIRKRETTSDETEMGYESESGSKASIEEKPENQ